MSEQERNPDGDNGGDQGPAETTQTETTTRTTTNEGAPSTDEHDGE